MQQRKFIYVFRQPVGKRHDDRKNHRGRSHHGGSNQYRLGCRFESVSRPVIGFQQVFSALEVHIHVVTALEFTLNPRHLLN